MPAKPLQTALGSLIIQKQYDYSDRELVEQIRENPYYQFFIGLPGYQDKIPYVPSLLVEFRKRLTEDILNEINEMIAAYNTPDDDPPNGDSGSDDPDNNEPENKGTGHYPERVLVDQIYRNRNNIAFCKAHGIRISGPALGKPKQQTLVEKKLAYADNTDRIEVERGFSLANHCYGLGLIRTKLDTTTRSSITVSIIAMNVDHLASFLLHFMISILSM